MYFQAEISFNETIQQLLIYFSQSTFCKPCKIIPRLRARFPPYSDDFAEH
jgi:hypothetical protein